MEDYSTWRTHDAQRSISRDVYRPGGKESQIRKYSLHSKIEIENLKDISVYSSEIMFMHFLVPLKEYKV